MPLAVALADDNRAISRDRQARFFYSQGKSFGETQMTPVLEKVILAELRRFMSSGASSLPTMK